MSGLPLQGNINKIQDGISNNTLSINPDGSINCCLLNQTLIEQKTQVDAVNGVITFSDNISGIGIYNTDTTNQGVFTVNGITINVPAGKYVEFVVGGIPNKTVSVSGTTSYIVSWLV